MHQRVIKRVGQLPSIIIVVGAPLWPQVPRLSENRRALRVYLAGLVPLTTRLLARYQEVLLGYRQA